MRWAIAVIVVFLATYGATNWLAEQRATRFRLYFSWELGIPFVPWMIYVYFSFNLLTALPLFLRNAAAIERLGRAYLVATLIAAVIHAILPTDLGWARPAAVPGHPVFARLFAADRPHNLVPSLHVAYSALAVFSVWAATKRWWLRLLTAAWLAALIASVLLVHQHHLADVAAGLVLAWQTSPRTRYDLDVR